MKHYRGGESVEPGLYFNIRQLSFKSVEDDHATLPGTPADTYRRVPLLAMLVVGPVLGLVYVVFLPFIGTAMVLWLLGTKAAELAAAAARETVRVLRPGWEPSMAFFSRTRRARVERSGSDEWAESARKKIEEPRA